MKKILFVASSLTVGGMERVLVDISNNLVKRGFDITIITYEENAEQNWLCELDERVKFIYKKPRKFNIRKKIPYVHRFYRPNKWETRTSSKALYKYYVGSKTKYDVEIAICRGPAVKIISGSTNKKSKKYTWVHNDYTLVNPKSIVKFFNSLDETKDAYKCFDKIVAVSNEAKKKFVEVIGYEEKLITIYNLLVIDEILKKSKLECPINKKSFTMISVARLIPAKGHDMLLRVAKRLNADGLDFEVWIVGTTYEDDYNKSLVKFIEDNNLTNIKMLGRCMNPYSFMNQSDLYVCSSKVEGFSISVAEAIACNLPVITTKCTGPTEILDDGKYGIIVDFDEDQLYKALKNAIVHPEMLHIYINRAQERREAFSENNIINQIIELF